MKEKRHSEEQIALALRQAEACTAAVEICRKMGISEATFYRWKKRFQGMGVAALRRLRQLEEENRKLKQLVADLTLDKHMLPEVLKRKWCPLLAAGRWWPTCSSRFSLRSAGPAGCCRGRARVIVTGALPNRMWPCGCTWGK